MAKLIAAINMTLDGFCDHTASADAIIFGRITYQLIEYWRPVVENPTGNKSIDDFAAARGFVSEGDRQYSVG
jgi:hypothetical protein